MGFGSLRWLLLPNVKITLYDDFFVNTYAYLGELVPKRECMTLLNMLGLAGAMLLLAITPGPGVFVTVASALASGFARAVWVVAGIVMGDLIFLLLAIYGLSAMAEFLGGFFVVIKCLGGAYLIWLGYKIWCATPTTAEIASCAEPSKRKNFFSGLAITLGNPKVILFYLGFLPTFVDLSNVSSTDVLVIVSIVSFVLSAVMLAYAYSAVRAKQLFNKDKTEKQMNHIAGSVMIATGTVLLAKT